MLRVENCHKKCNKETLRSELIALHLVKTPNVKTLRFLWSHSKYFFLFVFLFLPFVFPMSFRWSGRTWTHTRNHLEFIFKMDFSITTKKFSSLLFCDNLLLFRQQSMRCGTLNPKKMSKSEVKVNFWGRKWAINELMMFLGGINGTMILLGRHAGTSQMNFHKTTGEPKKLLRIRFTQHFLSWGWK